VIEVWDVTIPALTGERPRRAYCYVPDAWQEDQSQRYPVLYMFDGHNVFFDADATYGKSWGMLDYMDRTGTPLIIAAVECDQSPDNGRLREYCPYSCEMPGIGKIRGRGKTTMEWFIHDFKPFIDEEFPTLPDRGHTFLGGSSMGGLMTLYGVMAYNKVFSRGAALSPSVWFNTERLDKLLRTARIQTDTVLYMDYGARELGFHPNMAERFSQVADILLERKVDLTTRIVPNGNHSEASWEKQIPFFMNTLLYELD
jgi:predicted alpha/beta superfamily hydrolase